MQFSNVQGISVNPAYVDPALISQFCRQSGNNQEADPFLALFKGMNQALEKNQDFLHEIRIHKIKADKAQHKLAYCALTNQEIIVNINVLRNWASIGPVDFHFPDIPNSDEHRLRYKELLSKLDPLFNAAQARTKLIKSSFSDPEFQQKLSADSKELDVLTHELFEHKSKVYTFKTINPAEVQQAGKEKIAGEIKDIFEDKCNNRVCNVRKGSHHEVEDSSIEKVEHANCEGKETQFVSTLKKCTGCKIVFYCGIECQKNDWAKHKTICNFLQKIYKS